MREASPCRAGGVFQIIEITQETNRLRQGPQVRPTHRFSRMEQLQRFKRFFTRLPCFHPPNTLPLPSAGANPIHPAFAERLQYVEPPPRLPQPGIELAVLDAPVLARGVLSAFLLHLAEAGAFDPVWSDQIHTDWTRELHRLRPDIPVERLRHRRVEMERAFPVATVIPSRDAQEEVLVHCTTPPERKNAHVLATALSARAAVIVTDDSFRLTEVMAKLWHDTAVLSPDAWCLELLDRQTAAVFAGARAHRASLGGATPPDAWLALLRESYVGLPGTAGRLARQPELL